MRVPWIAMRSNQSILKKINPECSSEGLMLKSEVPTLWPPDAKSHSLEKTLILGKIEGKRRRGQQRMRCLEGIIDSMDMNLSKLREILKERETWHAAVHGITESDPT